MKLGNNAVKVSFKAYNKVAGDNIWVMAIKEHDSSVAEVGSVVPMSAKGNDYTIDTVVLSGVDFGNTPLHIAFMSEQGEFYVDDIKISVIAAAAGTTVEIPYKTVNATETSHALTDLPAGDYAYQVVVKRTKDFLTYTSGYSNRVDVKLLGTDVEYISSEEGDKAMKVIREGQLWIIHKDQQYNILGERK
jgi:DNA-binding beta-propeller fold protein YncE